MEFTNWSKDEISRYIQSMEKRMRLIRDWHCLDPLGSDYKSTKAYLLHQYIESRVDEALSSLVSRKPILSRSEGTENKFRIGRPSKQDNAQNGAINKDFYYLTEWTKEEEK